jgi:hypothetical protein
MLARTFPSLLPDLQPDDALEVAALYSLRGTLRERPPTTLRPTFPSPHHSISRAGLVGGGTGLVQPGEISLAQASVQLCSLSSDQSRVAAGRVGASHTVMTISPRNGLPPCIGELQGCTQRVTSVDDRGDAPSFDQLLQEQHIFLFERFPPPHDPQRRASCHRDQRPQNRTLEQAIASGATSASASQFAPMIGANSGPLRWKPPITALTRT